MHHHLIRMLQDDRGATAIEYGLIAGLASIMIVAGARAIGLKLQAIFPPIAAAFP
jgi:pilus assembly protein Flp/PilA